jgi:hypothetical protein
MTLGLCSRPFHQDEKKEKNGKKTTKNNAKLPKSNNGIRFVIYQVLFVL